MPGKVKFRQARNSKDLCEQSVLATPHLENINNKVVREEYLMDRRDDVNRRQFLQGTAAAALAATGGMVGNIAAAQAQGAATEWGFPQPYEQISSRSIDWLRQRGWWPMRFGYQHPWSGQNALNIVVDRLKLLQARGLDVAFDAFGSGPEVIEAFSPGRVQTGTGGNFPYTSLLDRGVPARALMNLSPNLWHALIVPNNSPLRTIADLKTRTEAVVGLVTGSSAEFYFQAACEAEGITIGTGRNVIVRNLPLSEQIALPAGIDAVVPWDQTTSLITQFNKTGRAINNHFAYNIYEAVLYCRQELIDNVPDVVQAITDAFMEANLWIRLKPAEAVEQMAQVPQLARAPRDLLAQQIRTYNTFYKPTALMPMPAAHARESVRIRDWLRARNRLTRNLSEADYAASYAPEFMRRTLEKLGFKVPENHVFLPRGWAGEIGKQPYPDYITAVTQEQPQAFPEPGELTKPWTFGGQTFRPA
jgi:ABC-type nitrate/sulfonate/bicarbonate transport system substrate-binding protein